MPHIHDGEKLESEVLEETVLLAKSILDYGHVESQDGFSYTAQCARPLRGHC